MKSNSECYRFKFHKDKKINFCFNIFQEKINILKYLNNIIE